MRGNVCLRVDVCWLIWLIFDGCCIFSYIMKQLEISALDLLLLSNTELLIVVSMNVYIRIRWTLPLSPSNIHPRLYRSIDYMFFSSILAHHRPTKISTKKHVEIIQIFEFFFQFGWVFGISRQSCHNFRKRLLGMLGLEVSRTTRIILEVSRRFEFLSGRWSWGNQWKPPGFSSCLQGLAFASSCLGYILYMGIILHSYIYMCGW